MSLAQFLEEEESLFKVTDVEKIISRDYGGQPYDCLEEVQSLFLLLLFFFFFFFFSFHLFFFFHLFFILFFSCKKKNHAAGEVKRKCNLHT